MQNGNPLRAAVLSYLVLKKYRLFLGVLLAVAAVEFVDAAGGVHEFHLTCVERVGCVGNLDFDNRILNAFDLDGLFGVGAGTCDEHVLV